MHFIHSFDHVVAIIFEIIVYLIDVSAAGGPLDEAAHPVIVLVAAIMRRHRNPILVTSLPVTASSLLGNDLPIVVATSICFHHLSISI